MISDFLKIFEKPIKYLSLTGIWIDNDSTRWRITTTIFIHLLFVELLALFSIASVITAKSLVEFAEAVAFLPSYVAVSVKSINFILKKKKIQALVSTLNDLLSDSWIDDCEGGKLKRRIDQVYRIFRVYLTFSLVTFFAGATVPFIAHELPTKMWFPYDYKRSEFLFWLSVTYELLDGAMFAPITCIIDMFPVLFISFAIGMVEELSECLENLGSNLSSINGSDVFKQNEISRKFVKYTKVQIKLKALVTEIGNIFAITFWAQGFTCTLIFIQVLSR